MPHSPYIIMVFFLKLLAAFIQCYKRHYNWFFVFFTREWWIVTFQEAA